VAVTAITLVTPFSGAAQGGTLTNRDVVTLAGAGFSEGFILDTIASSQTQFDTNATALAELAKHAISERIIRVMMDQNAAGVVTVSSETSPVVMPSPNGSGSPKWQKAPRGPSIVAMAVQSGTPFYEWKSMFWGLWRKRVGVAPTMSTQMATQHLGPLYARPQQQQLVRASTYQPITYYMVAPR
jgi:hypothetical protein